VCVCVCVCVCMCVYVCVCVLFVTLCDTCNLMLMQELVYLRNNHEAPDKASLEGHHQKQLKIFCVRLERTVVVLLLLAILVTPASVVVLADTQRIACTPSLVVVLADTQPATLLRRASGVVVFPDARPTTFL
jgi:hypothetical protein